MMVQAHLNSPAKIKLVTGSYQEDNTARNLKQPGGICQLMLGTLLSLHQKFAKFLKRVKKTNNAHNATNRIRALYD
jgi:hypothetical protein